MQLAHQECGMESGFEQALNAACRPYSAETWAGLRPNDRISAIYRELRRIDAEHARARQSRAAAIADALLTLRTE
jgi:hypothetical protein